MFLFGLDILYSFFADSANLIYQLFILFKICLVLFKWLGDETDYSFTACFMPLVQGRIVASGW